MRRYVVPVSLIFLLLLGFSATALSSHPRKNQSNMPQEAPITRNLVFFGPAQAGLMQAGFNPSGSITVMPGGNKGTDKMMVQVQGLPPNTDFTVFLHELSNIPFGASEYIADLTTNNKGSGMVMVRTVILEAFALKTAGNPPDQILENTDLKFVAIWFADPKDSAPFVPAGFPVLPFDGDRSSGPVVLGTVDPLSEQ